MLTEKLLSIGSWRVSSTILNFTCFWLCRCKECRNADSNSLSVWSISIPVQTMQNKPNQLIRVRNSGQYRLRRASIFLNYTFCSEDMHIITIRSSCWHFSLHVTNLAFDWEEGVAQEQLRNILWYVYIRGSDVETSFTGSQLVLDLARNLRRIDITSDTKSCLKLAYWGQTANCRP